MVKRCLKDDLNRAKDIIYDKGLLAGPFDVLKGITPSPINGYFSIISKELDGGQKIDMPLKDRLKAYRNGFTSRNYSLCGIDNSRDPELYLSELDRIAYTSLINKDESLLLNKIKFHRYMTQNGFDNYMPSLYGTIMEGEYKGIHNLQHLLHKNKIVIKPAFGKQGMGIFFCEKTGDDLLVNGNKKTFGDLKNILSNLHNYMVVEFCQQSNFLERIYPHSANTMRILTMYPENESPFIADAILRIGTKKSGSMDNLSKGGLTASINTKTGELGEAAEYLSSGETRWHEVHPDTKSKIKGVTIPKWINFKNKFMSMITELPEFKYVGWDILMTGDDDYVIIEGNSTPMVTCLQVHKPLLKNPKVRKFYRDNGVPV